MMKSLARAKASQKALIESDVFTVRCKKNKHGIVHQGNCSNGISFTGGGTVAFGTDIHALAF